MEKTPRWVLITWLILVSSILSWGLFVNTPPQIVNAAGMETQGTNDSFSSPALTSIQLYQPSTVSGDCWKRIPRVEVIYRYGTLPTIEMVEEEICSFDTGKTRAETLGSLRDTYSPGDPIHDAILYYLNALYERKRAERDAALPEEQ